MSENCLFCRIASGEIRANVVAQNDHALAFRDINPQAPSHLLVIPKKHVASLNDADASLDLGALMRMAAEVARQEGLTGGYRVVVNSGPDGGQTVDHLHLHVLGGRRMTWPPG